MRMLFLPLWMSVCLQRRTGRWMAGREEEKGSVATGTVTDNICVMAMGDTMFCLGKLYAVFAENLFIGRYGTINLVRWRSGSAATTCIMADGPRSYAGTGPERQTGARTEAVTIYIWTRRNCFSI